MHVIYRSIVLLILLQVVWVSHADINQHLQQIKHDPNALYAFFKQMPKGGELHYHLLGGAYPEMMLSLAVDKHFCFDKQSWQANASQNGACQSAMAAHELINHSDWYQQALRAWSMKDFNWACGESGHDHFFNSFLKFYAVAAPYYPELLVDIIQRAANQHEHYLEILISFDPMILDQLAPSKISLTEKTFADRQAQLLADPKFLSVLSDTVNRINSDWDTTRQLLQCHDNPSTPACQITVKFQYYTLREQPLEKVFDQALLAFLVAQKTPQVVGVNLVQPEDGLISLRDYTEQMKIFGFLHAQYPTVAIALHAGELALGEVPPEALRFHIQQAISIGHSKRIGHGVDIAYENDPQSTLAIMKEKDIAVEVNLISNALILDIQGARHPLAYYLRHQVPVVLSTDDEGILRTDLTSQYVEAVLHHDLDYSTIKQINRNALSYAFLPGKSLWIKANEFEPVPVPACVDLSSQSCLEFVKQNEKAKLQRQLEIELRAFEKNINGAE